MNLDAVRALLRQRLGFSDDALSPTTLGTAVSHRLAGLKWSDPVRYAAHAAEDRDEFEALVDEVVVPETWFFRGGDVFAFLAARVKNLGRPARLLSVPCSTGEEPYSLAIALGEAGVSRESWSLTAIDVSERQLRAARRGVYGAFAFRQTDGELRRRHFHAVCGGWAVDDGHKQGVTFRRGNLIDPLFLAGEPPFDVVLCRNVLIYLHAAARRQVVANLERLVREDGLLGVGHAEPATLGKGWRRIGAEGLFLFERGREERSLGPTEPRSVAPVRQAEPPGSSGRRTEPAPPVIPPTVEDPLAQARSLADAGRLAEAFAACRAHHDRHGPSADLFALQGTVHHARHESAEAVRCFEKALYLQHDHRDALMHLMLIAREQGDAARAELLRKRLDRIPAEDA